ncbi:AAA-like domain-containing protein [Kamptonema formosum]|uniref:AAA-like domain-containing protein n=1 Tax=Kamptonema formosum TaxID=331992 RepID=UPI00034ABB12|nr:AAA-like domain-containing protein [Oscillatoria sp. PCC 10802]
MGSESDFTWEEAYEVANAAVYSKTGEYLTDIEVMVLRGAWDGLTYEKIAQEERYSGGYLNKDVGPKLWKKLSKALGESVVKANFKEALRRASCRDSQTTPAPADVLEFPNGPVPEDSPFYVERSDRERRCYEEILQPGALICIKAPKLMGKTSLLNRILAHAGKQGYKTVSLNLRDADKAKFSNLDIFLRWFSAYASLRINRPIQLDDYWSEATIGSMLSCKTYFQYHLLQGIDSPIVLGLDEVDCVFQYPHIFNDFFAMLRSWHEEAKIQDIWKNLRMVVVHSTEDYGKLDIRQSPFNVGLPVELPEFTAPQVRHLARRHGLDWTDVPVQQLMQVVGGHPYLVRLALYHLARRDVTLEALLRDAPTDAGIYEDHLRRHLETLQQHPRLAAALKQVVSLTEPVKLDTMQGYQLDSMGLIHRQGNDSTPRCELYRHYFRNRLPDET